MQVRLSSHAEREMKRRAIPLSMVQQILDSPEQTLQSASGGQIYQSRVEMEGKPYVVRVIVSESKEPPVVVTVYRSSKVAKYWRRP
jgi:hypothetical protein